MKTELENQLRKMGNKPEFVSAANEYYRAESRVRELEKMIAENHDDPEFIEDELKELPRALAVLEAKGNTVKAFLAAIKN